MPSWLRFGPWLSAAIASLATQGVSQTIPSSNLDLDDLGQVSLAGNFDAISLYQYAGQREGFNSNGTQSVLSQMDDGLIQKMALTDASIEAMCPFILRNGTYVGLIVAGNFTSIGGVDARSIALINTQTGQITPHVGIQGSVNAMLCDQDTQTVYIGGVFEASVSTNAITWTADGAWANLQFEGFDGPVTSITKASNGHIIWGGSFNGLGNGNTSSSVSTSSESSLSNNQVINIASANITSAGNSTSGQNIVCPTNSTSGSATPWLLQDNTPGFWQATMGFGYNPTKLRMWNTKSGGRGTRTWRFTALPLNGILNMTYTDPTTGEVAYCDATCPLSNNASMEYQDFYFVNSVGMNSFRIDVSAWYGSGGGLDGIELFQDDIYAYAIEAFNEPQCSGSATVSAVTTTGPWSETPSRDSNSNYLSAQVGPATINTTQVVFEPDVKVDGNYSVFLYTPGCRQDSTCASRGIVNVTGALTTDGGTSFTQLIYQTNDYDKYDPIYTGRINVATGSFRPGVTLRSAGLQTDQLIVASKIRFALVNSTGGLNGLFEYNPNQVNVDTDFSKSTIDSAGTKLRANAQILALATHNNTIYAAGQFTDDAYHNIMSIGDSGAASLPNAGLNSAVLSIYAGKDYLYVGGNFTGTYNNGPGGLNNVAAYHYSDNKWVALGTGLDGRVDDVSPITLNITGSSNETCIAFSGSFNNILAAGSTGSTPASGFAIWVPSKNAWLKNLDMSQQVYAGQMSAYTFLPNGTWIGAGTLASIGQALTGAVGLRSASSNNVRLQQLPLHISSGSTSTSSLSKRDLTGSQNVTGVVAGLVYDPNGRNITVLGGHFSATGNNSASINNLLFLNGSNSNTVTGLPSGIDNNSTFLALGVQNSILAAGGSITGEVGQTRIDGIVLYDFSLSGYRSVQPAALVGDNVIVSAIAPQPSSSAIYVGGSFQSTAQGLSCRSVCMYDTSTNQWNTVGGQQDGNVTALYWMSNTALLAAGNMTISGNHTMLATYDTKQQAWTAQSAGDIPGPITAFTPATNNADHYWVAGTANNGSTYLIEIDGRNVRPVVGGFEQGTNIRSMQVMPLRSNHGKSQYLDNDRALLVTGTLNLTGFGSASAALFNGTTFTPFVLSSTSDGSAGSISTLFTSKPNTLKSGGSHHSRGITILVALCAALGTIFLLILLGIILNRVQRKRNGYRPVPSVPYMDKNSNINRVPPERLFGSLGQRNGAAPHV